MCELTCGHILTMRLVFSTLIFSKINGHDRNVFKYSRLTGYRGNEHEGGQQEITRQNKNHIKIASSALQRTLHPACGEGPVAEEGSHLPAQL